MTRSARRGRRGPWRVPAIAGALIGTAFVADHVLGDGAGPLTGGTVRGVLLVAAAVVAGVPVARSAVRALVARTVSIDLLVTIAAAGAVVIGEHWEAAAVTFLFTVGHALEARTLARTRSALAALVAAAPEVAVVVRDGVQVEVPAAQVAVGETVVVKNGTKMPVDGVVLAGTGALDEASITGESLPAEKSTGDRVFAGTVSRGGLLQVEAVATGASTTLARIVHRVEEAQDAKAPTQVFMERFSRWYTPGIVVAAGVVGLLARDVELALTLLVIACPGALVISVPVAVVAGIGRAAREGILVKGGEHLEATARIDAVALDKTGTLTRGRPALTDVVPLAPGATRDDVLSWAARAEAASEHPLARPVLDAAAAAGLALGALPERSESLPGRGIAAVVDGRTVLVGNAALLDGYGIEVRDVAAEGARAVTEANRLATAGRTPMIVALDGRILGVIGVADRTRETAAGMVRALHAAGVREVVMLTGDSPRVAEAIGSEVGVDTVRAGLLPEDKLTAVRAMQARGRTVAMVGDGVNDAPALAAADVGVAMGAAGSAVAVETAPLALMGDDLRTLPVAITLARRTVRVMRQNIAVALVTVAALLAGVLVGGVTMAVGMLVHEASVLVVVANAMRLVPDRRGPTTAEPGSSRAPADPRAAALARG